MRKRMTMMGCALGAMTAAERFKGRYMRDGTGHPAPAAPLELKTWLAGVEDKLKAAGASADKLKEIDCRLLDVEQKSGRRGDPSGGTPPTLGKQFIEAKANELSTGMGKFDRVSLEMKAATVTSSTAAAAGSAGGLVVPHRDAVAMLPRRRLTIRALLTVIPVESGSVQYPRQKTHATGADMVAEGALKPPSDLQFDLVTTPINTIAHWVKASRQILDDAPQLGGLIDSELLYGLALKEEAQLLYGDGTGQNLPGMIPAATPYAAPFVITNSNYIDEIGLAVLQAALTNLDPDGIVMHPADWWKMRLLKDAQGKYLMGDPMQQVPANLFGLPVVPTQAINAGEFLVGAFEPQTIYDRWTPRVEVGFDGSDFTHNLVTVLGEERIGFAAKQPQALIHGNFS